MIGWKCYQPDPQETNANRREVHGICSESQLIGLPPSQAQFVGSGRTQNPNTGARRARSNKFFVKSLTDEQDVLLEDGTTKPYHGTIVKNDTQFSD